MSLGRNHDDLRPAALLAVTMLVAGIRTLGGNVETFDVDDPRPLAADEVLIDVLGAGVGNWDNIIRYGVGTLARGRHWHSASGGRGHQSRRQQPGRIRCGR